MVASLSICAFVAITALRPTIKQSDRNSLVTIVESISSVGANSLKLTVRDSPDGVGSPTASATSIGRATACRPNESHLITDAPGFLSDCCSDLPSVAANASCGPVAKTSDYQQ